MSYVYQSPFHNNKYMRELSQDSALDVAYILSGTAYYTALQEFATGYHESELFTEACFRLHYNNIERRLHDVCLRGDTNDAMLRNILRYILIRGAMSKRTTL